MIGGMRERAQTDVLQTALPPGARRQALAQGIAAPQEDIVDHPQRVGATAQGTSYRGTIGQRERVGLGRAQGWRPGQAYAGAAAASWTGLQTGSSDRRAHLRDQLRRTEADVTLAPGIVALEGLLRGERAGSHQIDDVALLEYQVAARIDDHVGQAVTLLRYVIVVGNRQVQRFHPRAHQICDLRPLDLLRVVVARLVAEAHRILAIERKRSLNIKIFVHLLKTGNPTIDHEVAPNKTSLYVSS